MRAALLSLLAACAPALQAVNIGVNVEDGRMTAWGLRHGIVERNPLLGEHPSTTTLVAFDGAVLALNMLVWYKLPKRWRPWWSLAGIAIEGLIVWHNHSLGMPW